MVTFGPVVSEEKSFESVDGRRTDDGGLPYYKLPRSLRLRGANNCGPMPDIKGGVIVFFQFGKSNIFADTCLRFGTETTFLLAVDGK